MRGLILSLIMAGSSPFAVPVAAAEPAEMPSYVREADIAAPDGHWDFTSWDAERGRVLVAHGSDVLVVTPANGRNGTALVRAIGTIDGAHGVLAIPGTNRVLVTSGKDNSVRILDADSGAQIARITVPADPDAALIGPDGTTAYIMTAKAGIVSIIDLSAMREVRQIKLKPGLEVPVLVNAHLLAVNNEDENDIELGDPVAGKALGKIALPGCEGPTGLAYVAQATLALAACANGQAALVDLSARKLIQLVPIGAGPDTAIWDAARQQFLIPSGKTGTLSIIRLKERQAQVLATVPTEPSARTATLDPASGRVFLPAAKFAPAEPGKRGTLIPGSFHLVVVAPAG